MSWFKRQRRDAELEALVRVIDGLLAVVAEHTRLLTTLLDDETRASRRHDQGASAAELLVAGWRGELLSRTRAS